MEDRGLYLRFFFIRSDRTKLWPKLRNCRCCHHCYACHLLTASQLLGCCRCSEEPISPRSQLKTQWLHFFTTLQSHKDASSLAELRLCHGCKSGGKTFPVSDLESRGSVRRGWELLTNGMCILQTISCHGITPRVTRLGLNIGERVISRDKGKREGKLGNSDSKNFCFQDTEGNLVNNIKPMIKL